MSEVGIHGVRQSQDPGRLADHRMAVIVAWTVTCVGIALQFYVQDLISLFREMRGGLDWELAMVSVGILGMYVSVVFVFSKSIYDSREMELGARYISLVFLVSLVTLATAVVGFENPTLLLVLFAVLTVLTIFTCIERHLAGVFIEDRTYFGLIIWLFIACVLAAAIVGLPSALPTWSAEFDGERLVVQLHADEDVSTLVARLSLVDPNVHIRNHDDQRQVKCLSSNDAERRTVEWWLEGAEIIQGPLRAVLYLSRGANLEAYLLEFTKRSDGSWESRRSKASWKDLVRYGTADSCASS